MKTSSKIACLGLLCAIVLIGLSACSPAATPTPVPTAVPAKPAATSAPVATAAPAASNPSFDAAKCFVAAPSNDKTVKYTAKKGPYKIAVSNSFIGNAWRNQMIQTANAFVKSPEIAPQIKEFSITSSGQDVAAQIAAMDNMIASGVDAIILNAANPTSFDAVIKRAQDAGIVVVSFDNIVTTPTAVLVNEDQVEYGKRLAEDLVKRINGKGNVVMVNGVAGTSVSNDRTAGAKAVFAKSPDIKIIKEMEGNWDSGTGQKVMADFLATKPKIDGVWAQGGTPGVVKAFTDAGLPLPPMSGEAENGFRKALAASKAGGISIGQTPSMIAVSIQVALALLNGKETPRVIAMPHPIATSEELKEGVNYFKDLDDEFFVAVSIPACGVNLTPAKILAEQAK